MHTAGYIHATEKLAVSDTPTSFEVQWPCTTYLVLSDRAIHVRRSALNATDGDATTDDMPVIANERLLFNLYEDEQFSFVLADGETDGYVYVTPTSLG